MKPGEESIRGIAQRLDVGDPAAIGTLSVEEIARAVVASGEAISGKASPERLREVALRQHEIAEWISRIADERKRERDAP